MTISRLSNGRSFATVERGSTLTKEQPLDEVDVVICVWIGYWNPFFARHLNVLRFT